MAILAIGNFEHRHNRNGLCDSICESCLATVASLGDEDQLIPIEGVHICDPIRLMELANAGWPLSPLDAA